MSLLSVREIVMRFGGVTALEKVSLELNRGEVLGLIGPNGAGKTTLFNIISGVLEPTSGQVLFENQNLNSLKPHQRAQRGIARTFQNLQLWSSMTVLENLKLPMDALGKRNLFGDALGLPWSSFAEHSADERARAMLHVLDLLEHQDTLAGDLPVGIQRQVEVARALCLSPKLLLLDEPAAGLDAEETSHLAELLGKIRDRFKVSMLLVDHDMSLVMRACHFIYVLDFGRLLAHGRPEEIRDDPRVVAAYLGDADEGGRESRTGSAPEPPVAPAAGSVGETLVEMLGDPPMLATEPGANGTRAESGPLLTVTGLAAGYGGLEVIREVNLTVDPGEIVACIGANGAGKTTTLRAISGVIRARSGQVSFDGQDITRRGADDIVRMGLIHVPQGRGLFPKLSVEDTLRLASYSGHRDGDFGRAFDAFPVLRERRNQMVGTLSGGQQQMLAMARAILVRPKLLLVDEMSQGLAPAVVQQLFRWMATLREEGIAVFLVEQFVESALSVADRAYIFEQGSISHEAPAAELLRDQSLIAASYLGHGSAEPESKQIETNQPGVSSELMEEMMFRLPAELKRSLEERASREGRPADALVLELLGGEDRK